MSNLLSRLLGGSRVPKTPVTLRRFTTADPTISRDSVQIQGDSWQIDAEDDRVVRLFELSAPDAEQCLLTYRAALRSKDLSGRAYLEMWCRLPGKGEFFSRGLRQAVQGTTEWASFEIPFLLKKGQRPDLIKLNLAVEGRGTVWVKDVELLKTPR